MILGGQRSFSGGQSRHWEPRRGHDLGPGGSPAISWLHVYRNLDRRRCLRAASSRSRAPAHQSTDAGPRQESRRQGDGRSPASRVRRERSVGRTSESPVLGRRSGGRSLGREVSVSAYRSAGGSTTAWAALEPMRGRPGRPRGPCCRRRLAPRVRAASGAWECPGQRAAEGLLCPSSVPSGCRKSPVRRF